MFELKPDCLYSANAREAPRLSNTGPRDDYAKKRSNEEKTHTMNDPAVHHLSDDEIRRELAERGHNVSIEDAMQCATLCLKIAKENRWTLAIEPLGSDVWSAYYTQGSQREYIFGADADTLAHALARTALVGLRLANTGAPARRAAKTSEITVRLFVVDHDTHRLEEVFPESEFRLSEAFPMFLGPDGRWYTVPGQTAQAVEAEWLKQHGATPPDWSLATDLAAEARNVGFDAQVTDQGTVIITQQRRHLPKHEVAMALALDDDMLDLLREYPDGSVRIDT